MKHRTESEGPLPTTPELEAELERVRYGQRYRRVLRNTVYTLITVAAVAVLVATLWLPVLQIYGSSMTPTLQTGEIVLTVKRSDLDPGDIVAFYYNNKILVKRVIAGPGDWVDLTESGQVYVNETPLSEPYLTERSYGDTNIALPFQVPDGETVCDGRSPLDLAGFAKYRRRLYRSGADRRKDRLSAVAAGPGRENSIKCRN